MVWDWRVIRDTLKMGQWIMEQQGVGSEIKIMGLEKQHKNNLTSVEICHVNTQQEKLQRMSSTCVVKNGKHPSTKIQDGCGKLL